MADIGGSAGREYKTLSAQLKNMYDQQVEENRNNGWPNSGTITYINSIGVAMYCRDQAMYSRLKEIDRKLTGLWSTAQEKYSTAIQLNIRTDRMTNLIDQVADSIKSAIKALEDISGGFRAFKSELGGIQTKIKTINPTINDDLGFLRVMAYDELELVRVQWVEVKAAAGFFKRHGILLKRDDMQKLDQLRAPPPNVDEGLDIVGATFGGMNVTTLAKAMYSRGTTIEIPGNVRDFSDSWMTVEKTFVLLYTVEKGYRLFCCKEYGAEPSYTYTLRRDFSSSSTGSASHTTVTPTTAPANCPIEILAVLWGPERRTSQSVIDYCYKCVNGNSGIMWSNENFGGDSWSSISKSGTIFYRKKGSNEVQLVTGRERTVTQFNALKGSKPQLR